MALGAARCRGARLSDGSTGYLLDTSLLVSARTGLPPERATAVSVVSLGELHAGVVLATDTAERGRREGRLAEIRARFLALPVDEAVAAHYGEVLAVARRERRMTKATDLLIIATARVHGRVLGTADDRQARLARAVGLVVDGE